MLNENNLTKQKETRKIQDNNDNIPVIILPNTLQTCSKIDLITLISRMITFFIKINDSSKNERKLTRFHSSVPPPISIYNYLIRLTKYSSLEPCVLLTSVYYIDLLSSVYPDFTLNSLTVHRFLLTATSVASKGLCDSFFTNSHYAKVGGVQCSELNVLENTFLQRVHYRIIPRDSNIKLCKYESQNDHNILLNDTKYFDFLRSSIDRPFAGFNVLETYYKKITQLVGRYNPNAENFRKVSYMLSDTSSLNKNTAKNTQKRNFETVDKNNHNSSNNIGDINTGGETRNNIEISDVAERDNASSRKLARAE